ncbi:histidine phosphatase family protein [Pollutimonas bauzanensis]|uniref:Probable phosphoglycerate mutase n=1 Tax=Pollutimonas bauzanensis TaxID=658167 RepID=A0A1M5YRH6_9BURK|nr:histidine phosphatase family protein [Pollutimonas bauzanensis]SHI14561.1 probable phosphoglycerate mutase [Pollutimonas bauzanensis]
MSITHFWLVRHGETQWNASRRLQGWLDIPLSSVGIRQAEQLADYLRSPSFDAAIDAVVSSDLSRAFETARIAASHFGHAIEASPELRERSYGVYEGQDWAMLNNPLTGAAAVNFRDPQQDIEKGEALHRFDARIREAFEALARRHQGRNVLAFAHGGVIDIAWRRASRLSLDAERPDPILNTSINRFSIDGDNNWTLMDWGRVGHLEISALDDIV